MKKTYLLIIASMLTAASFAQSATGRSVFNSGGGTIGTPGGMTMLMSIGEPIAGMPQSNEASMSQGFLVASKSIVAETTAIDEVATTENAMVYPNPFSHVIHVNSLEDNIHIYVFNVMGQEVFNAPYQSAGADLSGLATGMYVVHATSNGKTIINTKILKQ